MRPSSSPKTRKPSARLATLLGLPPLRGHLPLVIALCVNAVGAGLSGPLVLLYLTAVGLPVATAGINITVSGLASLAVPAVTASLSGRIGARSIVIAAQLLQALGSASLMLAMFPQGRHIAVLGASFMALSVGQRAFWSSIFVLVADASTASRAEPDVARGGGGRRSADAWFALSGMAQGVGFTVGALLAGALLTVPGLAPYLLALALSAAAFVLSGALLTRTQQSPRPEPPVRTSARRLPDWPYALWIATNTLFAFCSIVLGVGLPLYLVNALKAPAWIVGPLLALNTVLGATCQGLAVRVSARFSRVRMLLVAGALWAGWGVSMAALGSAPPWIVVPGLIVAVMTYSTAELIHAPLSMGMASDAAPDASRASYLAWFQYSFAVASVVAPGLFALAYAAAPSLPWLLTAAASLLACLGTVTSARAFSARAGG